MQKNRTFFRSLIGMGLAFVCGVAIGQASEISPVQPNYVGHWLVEVEDGVGRDRLLVITKVMKKNESALTIESTFGFAPKGQPVSDAEINIDSKGRNLNVTAKSGAKLTTTQLSNDSFAGSFIATGGQSFPVKISRISEEELRARVEGTKRLSEIQKPAADVPGHCVAFSGKWTGTWGSGIGQQWLWVLSVDSNCMAKIAYLGSNRRPSNHDYEVISIKNGSLEWECNKSSNGQCIFTVHGADLWATYSNSSGGRNNAVFAKI